MTSHNISSKSICRFGKSFKIQNCYRKSKNRIETRYTKFNTDFPDSFSESLILALLDGKKEMELRKEGI